MTAIKEQFDAGVKVVQSFAKHGGTFQPSTTMMLTFYAFYKQATQGECHTPKPAFYDVVGKAKWDAWKQLGSMSSEQAMQEYVNELKKIVEAMPQTEVVQDFVEKLGSFYEMVDESEDKHSTIIESDRSRSQSTKDSDCPSFVEDENSQYVRSSENEERINGFVQKVKWPKYCHTNGDISSSEAMLIKSSKVVNDSKSSENAKVGQIDESQSSGDAYDDDDDVDEDAGNVEEDGESDEDDGDEDEDGINKETIVNHSIVSDDTFDEDEFCDTVDIPFHQEEHSHLQHLTNSSGRVGRESAGKSVSVQTDDSPQFTGKLGDSKNDEILSKVSAAVEAMQRNVVELERQIATLNELHNKKIRILKVFDFLNQYKVPGLCFVVLWPVVVGLLFNRYSRSSRRS